MIKISPRSAAQIAATVPTVDCPAIKRGNYRNLELLAKVRTLPCVHCGVIGAQAAHGNRLVYGKAKGMKASDAAIMALCVTEHMAIDNGTKYKKAELEKLQAAYIVKTYIALEQEGYLKIPPEILKLGLAEDVALGLIKAQEEGRLKIYF
jgi:hypothetical protein